MLDPPYNSFVSIVLLKSDNIGISLAMRWLGVLASTAGVGVQSLVMVGTENPRHRTQGVGQRKGLIEDRVKGQG